MEQARYAGNGGKRPAYVDAKWPTPTARDHKDTGDAVTDGSVPVNALLGRAVEPSRVEGSLNPAWVEALMGYPQGWTDPDAQPPPHNIADHRWPAPPGPQYDWEPPRIAKGIKHRTHRLKALGNAVVPQVVEVIGRRLRAMLDPAS